LIPIFTEEQIRRVVPPDAAVAAVRDAFAADGRAETVVPAVINLPIPGTEGEFHVKTAYVAGIPIIAVKVASGFYDNPLRGLPTGSGLMMLFDASTGMPAAILLDNGYLTDVRTGAAGAVAAACLARPNIRTVGVIGSGVQARQQVVCLHTVRSFERLVAWSNDPPGLKYYVEEMRQRLGIDAVAAAGPEAVVREADVLVTCTPSRTPIVAASWLHAGMHITAVGSDGPGKRELEARCLQLADLLVCDRIAQCAHLGELQHAIAAGMLSEAGVHAELGQVVAGVRPCRTTEDQITIADLTGVGFQDTAIANLAYSHLSAKASQR
jgi:ectoine utilization protein EutC